MFASVTLLCLPPSADPRRRSGTQGDRGVISCKDRGWEDNINQNGQCAFDGNQKVQHVRQFLQKRACLRERHHIILYLLVIACLMFQLVNTPETVQRDKAAAPAVSRGQGGRRHPQGTGDTQRDP